MSSETSTIATGQSRASDPKVKRRSRPMSYAKELLFFGCGVVIAILLQLAVLLYFSDVVEF